MSSKITLSKILRNILSTKSDYCCLCFNSIHETEISYKLQDEIVLGTDTKTEIMDEVISDVLGVKALDSISEYESICQQCVEIIINSYKFIKQCRSNMERMHNLANSLLQQTQEISELDCDFKTVFIAVDSCNSDVELYYDKYRNSNDQTLLQKRFQKLLNDSLNLYIDFELEPKCSGKSEESKPIKKRKSIPLSDIVLNKDDLNNLICKFCLKIFPTAMKIKQHYVSLHGPKKFQCTKCPKSFRTVGFQKAHMKFSHCDLYCSFCGKNFDKFRNLKNHEQSHVSCLCCKTCGKTYKVKKAYIHHIENKMCKKLRKSNAESIFECDYCGKKYSQKHNLVIHIRFAHENGKAFECGSCSKTFAFKSKLEAHIVKHTKQKNHDCTECGKRFASKTTLLVHTRTHTGEKPYKCEYCEMSFSSSSRRWDHVKGEHTERNMECDICHGRFKRNKTLNRHRKLHFDIRSRLYQNKPSKMIQSKHREQMTSEDAINLLGK
nr:zinc finger protein 1 homolog [Helicoverpa armigera]